MAGSGTLGHVLAGIDLGGTQVRISVALEDGRVIGSAKTRTALVSGPEGLARWAAREAKRLAHGKEIKSAAIGAPGPIDTRRGVLVNPPNLPGWQNSPLAELLSEAMGCPVYLENDANLAGLGEFHQGAGVGTTNMIYMTWSTGIGGGLILGGQLYAGSHGTAGEVGHMILNPDGPLDACGQRGCLEVYAGGRAMQVRTGESAAEIFDAAAGGDQEAYDLVQSAARYVGVALISLTNILDPDMIVIGGGVTRSWGLVAPTIRSVLQSSPFITPSRRPDIRRARLGDRAGQVGAVEWARIQRSKR